MIGIPEQWRAWPAGSDPAELARANARARDRFLEDGFTENVDGSSLRGVVAESWRRCLRQGVLPDGPGPPVEPAEDEFAGYRREHPLAVVMPVVRRLLVADATEAGLIVAVSDAAGRLLWVEGAAPLRRRAEGMSFVAGADWSEAAAGTNAPGTALALDHAIQIYGAEHLCSPVTPWSCTAAPIHGPQGELLGALDVTGGSDVAAPHTLRLVLAVAAAAEAELRTAALLRQAAEPETPRLSVLGRDHGELRGTPGPRALRLRHAELLLLLAEHPEGRDAEQLEAALHQHASATVTARAEISRLRPLVEELGIRIRSRPYRLQPALRTDADDVRDALRAGRAVDALRAYPGPVLPRSEAPGIRQLRDDLHRRIRSVALTAAPPQALLEFARRPEQVWDSELWRACRDRTPAGTPLHLEAAARVRELDRELAPGSATLRQPSGS